MSTILISVFAWLLLHFRRSSSENEDEATVKKPTTDGFLDMLARSPARKTKTELFTIIESSLADFDERDLVTLLQDGIQAYIRPGMGEEETFHVIATLLKPLGSLVLLQSNRLYGGLSGKTPITGTSSV